MRFDGQTVFVTGAAAGIGRAIAEECAAEGGDVIVTDVDREGGEETVTRVEAAGGDARFARLDVRDANAFEETLAETTGEAGPDVLVNNAGIGHQPASLEDTDLDTRDRVVEINAMGMWNGCRAALPGMKEQGTGAIVNVSSLAGLVGLPSQAAYSLSKGAIVTLTKAIAAEAGPHGVRANAVCPGFVDTDLGRAFFETRENPEEARERMEAQYPLKRLGEPEEVAGAVSFLASEDASYVTGHALVVDGGYSAA
jgi:NAD(P)-dependent dehydrogenase (short-subunit alcohol dehydrogenase family)